MSAIVRDPAIAPRVSWGAIFAGFFMLLAVWILLAILGLAIGLTALSPQEGVSGEAYGVSSVIWALLAAILASFFGGWLAARVAGAQWRRTGALHGTVVWALGCLMAIGSLGSGLAAAGQGLFDVLGAGGKAAQSMSASALLRTEAVQQKIAGYFEQAGVPAPPPQQLEAAVEEVAAAGLVQGQVDQQTIAQSLRRHTDLADDDANRVAAMAVSDMNQALSSAKQQATDVAGTAADIGAATAWGIFALLILSLGACLLGGAVGSQEGRRRREPRPTFAQRASPLAPTAPPLRPTET